MSESTDRATRRELRRAFGPEVCETIQQHESDIRALTAAHRTANASRSMLEQRLSARLDEQAAKLIKIREQQVAFESKSWLNRLRWFVFGRSAE